MYVYYVYEYKKYIDTVYESTSYIYINIYIQYTYYIHDR